MTFWEGADMVKSIILIKVFKITQLFRKALKLF